MYFAEIVAMPAILFSPKIKVATRKTAIYSIITHAPVHINDFRGVRARYVKRTG